MAEEPKILKPKSVIIHRQSNGNLYRQKHANKSRSSTQDTIVDHDRHQKMLLLNPEYDARLPAINQRRILKPTPYQLETGQNPSYKTAYMGNKKEANKWQPNIQRMRHEYKPSINKYTESKRKPVSEIHKKIYAALKIKGGRRTRFHSRRNISRRRRHVGRRRTHRNGA